MQIPGISLQPSPICLGTAPFGSNTPEADSVAVLDAYAEAGGNFLDTAHIYGAWIPGRWGASEEVLGRWLRENSRRPETIVATKGGCTSMDNLTDPGRCSYAELRQDLSESLERLQLDRVDLYWLHRDNENLEVGDILEGVMRLMAEGEIASYGLSNWEVHRAQAALDYCAEHGLTPPVGAQTGFACARYPKPEPPLPGMRYANSGDVAWHSASGLSLVAYTSQAGGWFGEENVAWARGGFDGAPPRGEVFDAAENRRRLVACMEVAESKGASASQIALAWQLHQPCRVTPIIGTSKSKRAAEAMAAARIKLDSEELTRIAPEF